MLKRFDRVRARLEAQYQNVPFDPETGMSHNQLLAEFEQHMAENPCEPGILTRAWLLNLLCTSARLAVESDDYFVGKLEHHGLPRMLQAKWRREAGENEFASDPPLVTGLWTEQLDCGSHVCPDWRNLLNLGVRELRDRAASRNTVFHKAVAIVYGGVMVLLKRFDKVVPHLQLSELAERPPRTLQEALQLAYIYHELQELNGIAVRSMGRFDLLYNGFYLADLKNGRINREEAKELLKYFMIKFYAQSQGKQFGKPFLFGPDVNEMSYLAFEVFRELGTVDPKFHVRLAERTPDAFLKTIAECIQSGCTSVVIVNDDKQVAMLRQHGKTVEDAEDYILIGCYEPAVMGKELNCSGASSLNLAKVLEIVLEQEVRFDTFDKVMDAYINTLDSQFTVLADRIRRWERLWPQVNPSPLLSGLMDSCIESGLDVSEAGAEYNTTGCCCVGLANVVDSLMVIRQLVFEDGEFTLSELRNALRANWEGYEKFRLSAIHRVSKWGNNDDPVDEIGARITEFLGQRINNEPNARGGVFQAALYGITVAARELGRNTGALPDGRLAGEPLTLNTGASSGLDKAGVTGLINSVTKINLAQFPNGTVLDIMLHPTASAGSKGVETIISVIKSYFRKGGMAVQFNILDADQLRDAQLHPEKHANLQVRLCGWSVKFADLTPQEQEMFIVKSTTA